MSTNCILSRTLVNEIYIGDLYIDLPTEADNDIHLMRAGSGLAIEGHITL
ncbi:hypothetical protein ACQJ2X_15600 [Bacillus wiedmannii]